MEIISTVNQIILEIMAGKINEADLTPGISLIQGLGATSIQLLEMALTISVEFDIDIPKDEITNVTTLGDVYQYVSDHVNNTN